MKAAVRSNDIASTLASFRRVLRRHEGLARAVRISRALIHFGPWRHAARALIRARRPPLRHNGASAFMPTSVDPAAVAAALRTDGICVVGQLPPHVVASLRAVTDHLPVAEYTHFDDDNDDVRALVTDETVLDVARGYFGAEPVLLECSAVVHEPGRMKVVGPGSQQRFHFDYAGWQSLNLFVYLTDVDEESGAHELAVGTHRRKTVREAVRASLDDDEALRKFGGRIRTITGPAGTMFFEDTEAWHRRRPLGRRRVMLNILFASHRSVFSRGRLGRPYAHFIGSSRSAATPVDSAAAAGGARM